MSNPDIVDWVKYEGYKPGSGGQSKIWTDLAKEYAGAL